MKTRNFLKLSVILGMMLATLSTFAETAIDIACFTSANNKIPIRFEMRMYFDPFIGFSFGAIKYDKSKTVIPIILQSEKAIPQGGRTQDEITSTWLEVIDGKVSGTYRMTHQGASVKSLAYTNVATKKTIDFLFDTHTESTLKKGCIWNY